MTDASKKSPGQPPYPRKQRPVKQPPTLLDKVVQALHELDFLGDIRKNHVVVAYSGGKDSTALLHLLVTLRNQRRGQNLPFEVTAAYYDHGWRGHPPAEMQRIQKNCEKWQVPLVWIPTDLTLPKTEAAGREARYRELTRLTWDLKAHALVTAHHADDQVETLLYRIFRGTGIDGLIGIHRNLTLEEPHGSPVAILRPLLNIYRQEIDAYVEQNELRYYDDPTNTDTRYQRNAIRRDLLPSLEKQFPQLKSSLLRLSELAEGESQILNDVTLPLWKQMVQPETESFSQALQKSETSAESKRLFKPQPQFSANSKLALDTVSFNQLSLPYQRRLIKQFLIAHHLEADYHTIEGALEFISGKNRHNSYTGLRSVGVDPETGRPKYMTLYKGKLQVLVANPPKQLPPVEPLAESGTPAPVSEPSLQLVVPTPPMETTESSTESMVTSTISAEPPPPSTDETIESLTEQAIEEPARTEQPQPTETFYSALDVVPVSVPGETHWNALGFSLSIIPFSDEELSEDFEIVVSPKSLSILVSLEKLQDKPLTLRTRRPKDRIQPLGMSVSMRLKHYLINRGVPRFQRDQLPLLTCGQDILWVPGVGIAEGLRIHKKPTHRLVIQYNQADMSQPAPPLNEPQETQ